MHVGIILHVPPRARSKYDLCVQISYTYTHVELYQFYFSEKRSAKFSSFHGANQRRRIRCVWLANKKTDRKTYKNCIYFFRRPNWVYTVCKKFFVLRQREDPYSKLLLKLFKLVLRKIKSRTRSSSKEQAPRIHDVSQVTQKVNEEWERKRNGENISCFGQDTARTCVEINYGVIAIVNPSVKRADLTLSFVANHRAGHTLNRFYIRGGKLTNGMPLVRTGERVVLCTPRVLYLFSNNSCTLR